MVQGQKTVKVEQVGSPQRRHHDQRATLIGLGLNKIGRVRDRRRDPQGAALGAGGRRREIRRT